MVKFAKDEHLADRAKPAFQNVLHRTLEQDSIIKIIGERERRFVKGY